MRKLISFVHISLDGFVCGPNGEMDWIRLDDGMFEFVEKNLSAMSDTALYGRVTYELMESYWPTAADQPNATRHTKEHAKWYKKANKIVLSTTLKEPANDKVTVISNDLPGKIKVQKEKSGTDIIIFGSPRASHSLMQYDLIDGYWLFVNPVLLGSGVPLFKNIATLTKLKRTSIDIFPSGVICSRYEKEQITS